MLPVRNLLPMYHHLFRPILLRHGLFHQIRIDHVLESCLYLLLQELLKEYWLTKVECYEVKHSPQRIMWRTDVASGLSYGQLSYQTSSYYSTDTGIFELW